MQSDIEIKRWIDALPSVDQVRPPRCPCCDAPSRPAFGPLGLHGHGVRERQVFGPLAPGGTPEQHTVQARRYRCLGCRAVILVVPRGMLPRRRYCAAVIGWVLARIGLDQVTTAQVRTEVCPFRVVGPSAADRWLAPSRWIEARRAGMLFPKLGRPTAGCTRRALAARTAMQLTTLAGSSSAPTAALAFCGAALAA